MNINWDQYNDKLSPVQQAFTTKVLEMEEIGITMASNMRLEVGPAWDSYVPDTLLYKLKTFVLTDRLAPEKLEVEVPVEVEYIYEVPASWFQQWKREWARDWVLDRWPVKYETKTGTYSSKHKGEVTIERKAMYPKANFVVDPRMGDRVTIYETTSFSAY